MELQPRCSGSPVEVVVVLHVIVCGNKKSSFHSETSLRTKKGQRSPPHLKLETLLCRRDPSGLRLLQDRNTTDLQIQVLGVAPEPQTGLTNHSIRTKRTVSAAARLRPAGPSWSLVLGQEPQRTPSGPRCLHLPVDQNQDLKDLMTKRTRRIHLNTFRTGQTGPAETLNETRAENFFLFEM